MSGPTIVDAVVRVGRRSCASAVAPTRVEHLGLLVVRHEHPGLQRAALARVPR